MLGASPDVAVAVGKGVPPGVGGGGPSAVWPASVRADPVTDSVLASEVAAACAGCSPFGCGSVRTAYGGIGAAPGSAFCAGVASEVCVAPLLRATYEAWRSRPSAQPRAHPRRAERSPYRPVLAAARLTT